MQYFVFKKATRPATRYGSAPLTLRGAALAWPNGVILAQLRDGIQVNLAGRPDDTALVKLQQA